MWSGAKQCHFCAMVVWKCFNTCYINFWSSKQNGCFCSLKRVRFLTPEQVSFSNHELFKQLRIGFYSCQSRNHCFLIRVWKFVFTQALRTGIERIGHAYFLLRADNEHVSICQLASWTMSVLTRVSNIEATVEADCRLIWAPIKLGYNRGHAILQKDLPYGDRISNA